MSVLALFPFSPIGHVDLSIANVDPGSPLTTNGDLKPEKLLS